MLGSVTCALLALPSQASAVSVSAVERAEVTLINRYRVSKGLGRLVIDTKLTRTAEWMGADMPAYNYFSHTDHLGRDPFARLTHFGYPSNSWRGENLAAGYEDAQNTFNQWKNSEGHRKNMLNRNYRAVGIARVHAPDSTYGYYWVTEFGSKVTKRVRAKATTSKRYTRAQKVQIKRRAVRCLTAERRGSASWTRLRCTWNVRTASRLGLV